MSDLRETQDYLAEVIADRDRLRAALELVVSVYELNIADMSSRAVADLMEKHARAALAGAGETAAISQPDWSTERPVPPANDGHRISEAHDRSHYWWRAFNLYSACRRCGAIRRADDQNGPCPGPVRIATREEPPPAPAPEFVEQYCREATLTPPAGMPPCECTGGVCTAAAGLTCRCSIMGQRWSPETCPIHRPTHQPSGAQ